MDHAELKETFEKGRTEKQNEDNEAPVPTKDNEEPNTLTGERQKKSDDNLKKKLPDDDTDQEDVADKSAGLAEDTNSQSTLQAVPTKDNEEPNALTGVRQKKSDDNLKKKLPDDDTDQKDVEDVADKSAGLAEDTDSQSTLQAVPTKDNEEPNALTGVRQKKSDDNLKKKLPDDDTDQKDVEDVADKSAGLAEDTDSQSTLQATPHSPDRVPAVSPRDAVPVVPNALVVNARSLRKKKSILQRRLDDDLNWAHVILVSETWYKDKHTEIERSINRYNGFFEDRKKDVSGKERGGGAAIYLSAADCSEAKYVYKESSPHSEAIAVTFLFRGVVWLAVCIYSVSTRWDDEEERTNWNNKFIPWVLASEGAKEIDLEQTIIVGGDLNHSEVTLPGFTNYVRTRTRGDAILDRLYTNNDRGWYSVDTVEDEKTHEQISDHFIVRALSQDI